MKEYNCETCGSLTKNKWHRKIPKFCSHKCANKRFKKIYDIKRPIVILSGKTKIINDNIIVNTEYYDWLNQYRWYINDNGYAIRTNNGHGIRMHRLIANTPKGMVTDHKNNNRLDNRLSNLRIVTQKENSNNRNNTRGYCWDKTKRKWVAYYKSKFYGRYNTEIEARNAYKNARSGKPYNKIKERKSNYHLPVGVYRNKTGSKYVAVLYHSGKRKHLGTYQTYQEAERIYLNEKRSIYFG
jgi:hypothetical protein